MAKTGLTVILTVLTLLVASCERKPFERQEVYWTGQIVKDCSEEPAPNLELYVRGYNNIYSLNNPNPLEPDVESEEIIRTTTDELGMYHFTFRPKRSFDGAILYLKRPEADFDLRLVRRTKFESESQDFAATPCVRTALFIENPMQRDSIYIGGLNELFRDYDTTIIRWVDNSGFDRSRETASIPLNGNGLELYYESEFPITSGGGSLYYGYSINEVRKAFTNRLSDTIPNDYNSLWWERKGYPFVDTIYIELN